MVGSEPTETIRRRCIVENPAYPPAYTAAINEFQESVAKTEAHRAEVRRLLTQSDVDPLVCVRFAFDCVVRVLPIYRAVYDGGETETAVSSVAARLGLRRRVETEALPDGAVPRNRAGYAAAEYVMQAADAAWDAVIRYASGESTLCIRYVDTVALHTSSAAASLASARTGRYEDTRAATDAERQWQLEHLRSLTGGQVTGDTK